MIKINLLSEGKRPAAVRRARATRESLPTDLGQFLLLGAILLALVGCVAYWFINRNQIRDTGREIDVAQTEYDKLEEVIKEVEAFKAKRAELEHKIDVITELKANQRGPVRVMDEISRAVPELLWLTDMQMSASQIKLRGQAYNNNAIASFTENLDRVPGFEEPDFKETKLGSAEVYDFAINLGFSLLPISVDSNPADLEDGAAESAAAGAGG